MKKIVSILIIWLTCSAWTFSFIEKPGVAEYSRALGYIETGHFAKADTELNIAASKALDDDTKSKVLITHGKCLSL